MKNGNRVQIHGFGGGSFYSDGYFSPAIDAPVVTEASLPAQIEYLQTCIRVRDERIHTLTLQLETTRLNRKLEENDFLKQVDALSRAQDTAKRIANERGFVVPPPKKKSWKFWSKRG